MMDLHRLARLIMLEAFHQREYQGYGGPEQANRVKHRGFTLYAVADEFADLFGVPRPWTTQGRVIEVTVTIASNGSYTAIGCGGPAFEHTKCAWSAGDGQPQVIEVYVPGGWP